MTTVEDLRTAALELERDALARGNLSELEARGLALAEMVLDAAPGPKTLAVRRLLGVSAGVLTDPDDG